MFHQENSFIQTIMWKKYQTGSVAPFDNENVDRWIGWAGPIYQVASK